MTAREPWPSEGAEDVGWTDLHAAPLPARQPAGAGHNALMGAAYASPSGFRPLRLDLFLPEPAPRPAPVVVWVHGGGFFSRSRSLLPGLLERARLFKRIPREGMALASIDYRLSGEARFPAQLHDVKAAIRWLRARGQELGIDSERIAVWGGSAGAHLAMMAAVTGDAPDLEGDVGVIGQSSAVTAAVDWYGPTDFAAADRDAPADAALTHDAPDSPEARLIGAPVQDRPDLVARANPCSWVTAGATPILVQHGTHDRVVPFRQSMRLVEALRTAGTDVAFLPVDGADHGFDGAVDESAIFDATLAFLRDHLRLRQG